MSMLFILIPVSMVLVGLAAWGFMWAVNSGQFDDLDTPAWEILTESQTTAPREADATEVPALDDV